MKKYFGLIFLFLLIMPSIILFSGCGKNSKYAKFYFPECPYGVEELSIRDTNLTSTKTKVAIEGRKGNQVSMVLSFVEGYETGSLKAVVDGVEKNISSEGVFTFTIPDHDFKIEFIGKAQKHISLVSFSSTVLTQSLYHINSAQYNTNAQTMDEAQNNYHVLAPKDLFPETALEGIEKTSQGAYYNYTAKNFALLLNQDLTIYKAYGTTFEIIVFYKSNTYERLVSSDFVTATVDDVKVDEEKVKKTSCEKTVNAQGQAVFKFIIGFGNVSVHFDEVQVLNDTNLIHFNLLTTDKYQSIDLVCSNNPVFDLSVINNGTTLDYLTYEQTKNHTTKLKITIKNGLPKRTEFRSALSGMTAVINGEKVTLTKSDSNYAFNITIEEPYRYSSGNVEHYGFYNIELFVGTDPVTEHLKKAELISYVDYNTTRPDVKGNVVTLKTSTNTLGTVTELETSTFNNHRIYFLNGTITFVLKPQGSTTIIHQGTHTIKSIVVSGTEVLLNSTNEPLGVYFKVDNYGQYVIEITKTINITNIGIVYLN